MKIEATFVKSAAGAADFPRDGLGEVALVGRSNVGKSSLLNALVRQRLARTSAAPGKTRLANLYRVVRATGTPLYLVDLPGYGYARGGREAAEEFDALTAAYFARDAAAGILLVDARHPGLESDLAGWRWLHAAAGSAALVATKIDKLSRAERQRAHRTLEAVFEHPVLPVSAVTGEGLDELWILIDTLATNSRNRKPPRSRPLPGPTAPRPPRRPRR
ncbi:MAG: ribosome biogenesis GTP-binding protein YihA/YsxC [Acidobacteriota bacterium]